MKLRSIILLVFLFVPTINYANVSTSKNWQTFWRQFSVAVKNKNKAAVKRLMSSEREFFSGGGGETRDEWLQMIDDRNLWCLLQRSVAKGTKRYNNGRKRAARITRDNHLIFEFINKNWRFVGIMGD